MEWNLLFVFNSVLLGVRIWPLDASSVSLANGLAEPDMEPGKMLTIAGVFPGFSGPDAYDRMDLRTHNCQLLPVFP